MAEFEIETCRGVDRGSSSTSAPVSTTTNSTLEVRVDPRTEPKPPKRRIERVPLTMRRDERTKGYFDPRVVSIGPYHHGKEELQMAERIKPIVAELFISGSGKDLDEFRKNVMGIVDDARSYYLEGSTDMYSDVEFVEMMLLDGLFVAAVIEHHTPGYKNPKILFALETQLGQHDTFLLTSDTLCLLENQISFQVLELLMSLKSKHHKLTEMLDKMLHSIYSQKSTRQDKKIGDTKQPIHLLEYFWLWQNKLSQSNHTHGTSTRHMTDYFYSFKSVAELKAKGIYARRGSDFGQRNFKFKSFFFFAVLEIPPIILNPYYVIHNSNQIAYEWMPNNPTNLSTMAYINFMKSLINTTEDVKELRTRDIVLTPCTSDEEVVQMFNSIPTIPVEDFSIYDEVKQSIHEHYNNKVKTWFAELIHNYFSSPWTFVAFVAAATLIILSFLQTFFTIFPRK
ncbi:hypothetical protein Vadar_017256 [Vaccinium darrowii]|uniref:Uncharacterized protein n=1 Tax=Vaccinium darrowii TaxID=229202 RepID=A0ACB7YMK7_9ERIC|nr:hypothetical protein Vadar_017256 [Vaccinium darrowii]